MGFSDFLFGSRPDIRMNPQLQPYVSEFAGTNFGKGWVGKWAKQDYKRLRRGDDVSSIGYFNPIRQRAAAERREIEHGYGPGGGEMTMISNAGGPQAAVFQRMKEMALDRSREREGMDVTNAALGLQQQLADQGQRSIDSWHDAILRKYATMFNAVNAGTYDARRQGGIAGQLLAGGLSLINPALGAAAGAGMR